MKKQIFAAVVFFFFLLIFAGSCKPKQTATATVDPACMPGPTYSADIKPLLDKHCAATCHSAEKHKHNIDLSTYESSKEVAKIKSFLGSINHEEGYDPMPAKADKLDKTTIDKITCWVKGGLPK